MNWGYTRSWAASLGWGDWPTLVACLIAGAALVVAFKAQRDGRRSATASEASAAAAVASVEEARLSRLASERSATVAEETLADQRREARERREAEEEASRPRVVLEIEHHRNAVWHLINVGTAAAENIRCPELPAAVVRGWDETVSLPPGEVYEFMISAAMGRPAPTVLRLVWDGQDEAVPVRVPGW